MNKEKSKNSSSTPSDTKGNKVGQLFPNASLEDYAKLNGVKVGHDDGEICKDDSEGEVCEDEDDNSANEDCDDDCNTDNEDCDDDGNTDNEDCDEKGDKNDESINDHPNSKNE